MNSSLRTGLAIGSFTVAFGAFTIGATIAARVARATEPANGSITATQAKVTHDGKASHDRVSVAATPKDGGLP